MNDGRDWVAGRGAPEPDAAAKPDDAAKPDATAQPEVAGPSAMAALRYQSGFGNHFSTEALAGALPPHNSPQRCPYGLYAEQVSGTAFTAPRAANRHTWLYRIRPAAMHGPFRRIPSGHIAGRFDEIETPPDRLRWSPMPIPDEPRDFIDGLVTIAGNGDPHAQRGCAIHLYAANRSMRERAFYDADGELLIVPQQGRLLVITELGRLLVGPCEFAVVPRGVRIQVMLADEAARGYVCESFGAPLRLPELGPIGSDALACQRDFESPLAWYEDREERHELIAKFGGTLWSAEMDHSPFDVVAWRGNHVPYRYDLRRFNAIGSVSFDHPDPSIHLALQSASDVPGVGDLDFVIFPPRWVAMEHTFRPPWYHRNAASELMGLVHGVYDAKAEGFLPGGASLHNCMSGHGPDAETFERALREDTAVPRRIGDGLAFMFESRWIIRPTRYALESQLLQRDYRECWRGLRKRFDPQRPEPWR